MHVTTVMRQRDGYRAITGWGSLSGCFKEARSVRATISRRGESFTEIDGGFESDRVLIKVEPYSEVKHGRSPGTYDPKQFHRRNL